MSLSNYKTSQSKPHRGKGGNDNDIMPELISTTGKVEYVVNSETFYTSYTIYHPPTSTPPNPTAPYKFASPPIILLHGGPGIPSIYLKPFADLSLPPYSIPIIFYDQLGCGSSTRLPKKERSFWTIELFMDELRNLLVKLGVEGGEYDLLGHSWGGILASEYVASPAHNKGGMVRNLVLADSMATMDGWVESTWKLIDTYLPPPTASALRTFEFWDLDKDGDEQSEAYKSAKKAYGESLSVFSKWFVCRIDLPPELGEAFNLSGEDESVERAMWGPAWINCTGTLAHWSIKPKLSLPPLHKTRTLIYNGAWDQAQDEVIAPFFDGIERCKWVVFALSSHMPHFEEREKCLGLVGGFLRGV